MSIRIPRAVLVLQFAALLALPAAGAAQTRPCLPPTADAQDKLNAFVQAITSQDPKYVAWAQRLGLQGLAPSDFVAETSGAVCTAVTDAIAQRLPRPRQPTTNLVVFRSGPRFLAIDPSIEDSSKWTVSSTYDDVRHSF